MNLRIRRCFIRFRSRSVFCAVLQIFWRGRICRAERRGAGKGALFGDASHYQVLRSNLAAQAFTGYDLLRAASTTASMKSNPISNRMPSGFSTSASSSTSQVSSLPQIPSLVLTPLLISFRMRANNANPSLSKPAQRCTWVTTFRIPSQNLHIRLLIK